MKAARNNVGTVNAYNPINITTSNLKIKKGKKKKKEKKDKEYIYLLVKFFIINSL